MASQSKIGMDFAYLCAYIPDSKMLGIENVNYKDVQKIRGALNAIAETWAEFHISNNILSRSQLMNMGMWKREGMFGSLDAADEIFIKTLVSVCLGKLSKQDISIIKGMSPHDISEKVVPLAEKIIENRHENLKREADEILRGVAQHLRDISRGRKKGNADRKRIAQHIENVADCQVWGYDMPRLTLDPIDEGEFVYVI